MGKTARILVVDDDNDILDLLEYNLVREGFVVKGVDDSTRAIEVARKFKPDLIILDIMMPILNGIELCKKIRAVRDFRETHIFFLTAKSEGYYREAAMDTGGDDFIEKIIGLRALIHKVVTVLKRKFKIRKRENEVRAGNITINRRESSVMVRGEIKQLTHPELEILYFFAQNPRKVITGMHIINHCLGTDTPLSSVDMHIKSILKKIGGDHIREVASHKYVFRPRRR